MAYAVRPGSQVTSPAISHHFQNENSRVEESSTARFHLASQSSCRTFSARVQKTTKAVGHFFYLGYAYVRLFFRAFASMGRGTDNALIQERVRLINEFRQAIESCPDNDRAGILRQFNSDAFADARRVLFVVTPKLLDQFAVVQNLEERRAIVADVVLDCRRAVSLQHSFKPMNVWYGRLSRRNRTANPTSVSSTPSNQRNNNSIETAVNRILGRRGAPLPERNRSTEREGRRNQAVEGLHDACARGNLQDLNRMIRRNADLNVPNANGRTPLQVACEHNQIEIVRRLLEQGAFVDGQNEDAALSEDLVTWIERLRYARDYTREATRPIFVHRVVSVIQFASENEAYRGIVAAALREVFRSGTCVDGSHLTLNRLEVSRRLMQIPDVFSNEGMQVFRGVLAAQLLEDIAAERVRELEQAGNNRNLDVVEAFLAYQVRLREVLGLPIECREMNYATILDQADYNNARDQVLGVLNDRNQLVDLLSENHEWVSRINADPIFTAQKADHMARVDEQLDPRMEELENRQMQMTDEAYLAGMNALQRERNDAERAWYREKTNQILDALDQQRNPRAVGNPLPPIPYNLHNIPQEIQDISQRIAALQARAIAAVDPIRVMAQQNQAYLNLLPQFPEGLVDEFQEQFFHIPVFDPAHPRVGQPESQHPLDSVHYNRQIRGGAFGCPVQDCGHRYQENQVQIDRELQQRILDYLEQNVPLWEAQLVQFQANIAQQGNNGEQANNAQQAHNPANDLLADLENLLQGVQQGNNGEQANNAQQGNNPANDLLADLENLLQGGQQGNNAQQGNNGEQANNAQQVDNPQGVPFIDDLNDFLRQLGDAPGVNN